ncbi:hypothetical protein JKP88DRAFT_269090 [Tribonema minus]|uniref:DUF268 domain-containing protein n=1 Tax=Tribonema minus TaxID=303371 RepID=A0A835YNA8_9STRA|nr:hypothetical protein JKP88DRAFT_269090 [Tribonema minus]
MSAWKPTPDFTLLTAWLKPEYPSAVPPPKDIPATYMDSFTMQGRVEIRSWYVDGTDYLGGKQTGRGWTKEGVEKLQQTTRTEGGNYGKESLNLYTALARYQPFFEDKRGVIIGSETPWAEAIALNHNVASIMTVEYGALTCDHPKIETKLVSEFTQGVLNGDIAPFDWAISYSSLEHDGMGRYGDVLNPDGDLHSMAKALTYVKPGGMFLLAVPQADADAVEWNAHRVYGPLRLPLLTAGWRLVDVVYSTVGVYQHLLVLQNTFGCSA